MTVRIEKSGPVWIVIHSRPEARNAMDPESAAALYEPEPLSEFAIPRDGGEHGNGSDIPMGAMGPSRLELDKPVIAAVAGPAVAGGMELAMWADFRVMEESAYMGVYCRRWGIPFIDGGTVRLPRLVGEGRALDLILTGRQVMADECERIGLCEYVVPDVEARTRAEELAHQIAQFPQLCARADRRSVKAQHGLNLRDALVQEWYNSRPVLEAEGIEGAGRFSSGDGRHGAGTVQPWHVWRHLAVAPPARLPIRPKRLHGEQLDALGRACTLG